MVRGDVELLEVVVVQLHLGPVQHHVPHGGEQVLELAGDLGHGMQGSPLDPRGRQGAVEAVRAPLRFERGAPEARLTLLDGGEDRLLELVGALTGALALLGREAGDRLEQRRHDAVLADDLPLDSPQGLHVGSVGDARSGIGEDGGGVSHGDPTGSSAGEGGAGGVGG